jgi:nifR3 family TIM-barrel protein
VKLLTELQNKPFVLAPMAAITDCAFRSYMRELGAGILTTELVSATGLKYQSEKTRQLMRFNSDQHPVGVQLFGEELEDLEIAAKEVEQMGADFVDLNFGCPVPKVVKKGAGSAVLKDLNHMRQILRTVKGAVQIPVTIKVRTGWDANTRNTHDVVQIAYDEGITWVAIHGRTRAQGYSGEADWAFISEVKSRAKLPIIGNGDIHTAKKACERLRESGCDGVMIGRGCLKNPFVFQEAQALWSNQTLELNGVKKDFVQLFDRLYFHLSEFWDDRMMALQLKKLSAWYSAGYPGSAQFRKSIFQLSEVAAVRAQINEYFSQLNHIGQTDTSGEAFLMGGHG